MEERSKGVKGEEDRWREGGKGLGENESGVLGGWRRVELGGLGEKGGKGLLGCK